MFESLAYAESSPLAAQPSPFLSMAPLLLILVVFYFLLIRPQMRRQRELQKLVDHLKKGDRVVTSGGVIGTIMGIQNDYVVLRVGDNENTKMEVLKSAISGLRQ